MNCPQCGQALDGENQFCTNCATTVQPVKARGPRHFEMVCLMSGVLLTNDIRTELYRTACEMGRAGCEKKALLHPDFEGTLSTDFSYCAFNSMGGVKFTADIEGDQVKGRVVFLLTNFDYVKDGIWVPVTPIPQSHPASKAQYN